MEILLALEYLIFLIISIILLVSFEKHPYIEKDEI